MSLDFGLFAKLLVDAVYPSSKDENKEKYENAEPSYFDYWTNYSVPTVLSMIISLILGIIAFTLSWTCNSALGYHVALKAFFGAVSFVFGFSYIVLYLLLRWDTCSRLMSRRR